MLYHPSAGEAFMKKYLVLSALVLSLLKRFALAVHLASSGLPGLEFTDTRLENGLRVILAPDHSAPVAALNVIYDAGSRNERPGRTGFAHLFEHMMYQGSENVGKGEHFSLLENNGGDFNGT
jgi:zinc protease